MAAYSNDCSSTAGLTSLVGTSLPTVSGGAFVNDTSGTQRTAIALHGIDLSNNGQIKFIGYGAGTAGSCYVALLNVDSADANPLYGYALFLNNNDVRLIRFDNAASSTTLQTAARTVTGATDVTVRAEFENNGDGTYDIKVYEGSTLKFTVANEGTYDLAELTRVTTINAKGGSGTSRINSFEISDTLESGPAPVEISGSKSVSTTTASVGQITTPDPVEISGSKSVSATTASIGEITFEDIVEISGSKSVSSTLASVGEITVSNPEIIDYLVQYRTTEDPGEWQTFADGESASPNTTVDELTPGESYDFRVAPVNVNGAGPWSNVVTVLVTSDLISKLYLGDLQVIGLYLGDKEVTAAYLGDVQIFG